MKRLISKLSAVTLILLCVGCDQSTKKIAHGFLSHSGVVTYLNGMIRLQYVENQGAFLGLGSKMPAIFRFYFFVVLMTIILTIFLLIFVTKRHRFTTTQALALIFILGGGLSNVLDRFANGGRVVDFMNLGIGNIRTGIFNVADVFILFGTVTLLMAVRKNRLRVK